MPRRTSGRLRKAKQKLRRHYTCDREDRQLSGEEPTTPLGAVRDERVDPSTQVSQPLSALELCAMVRQAVKEGWNVPDAAKGRTVDELTAALLDPDTKPMDRVRLARVLL